MAAVATGLLCQLLAGGTPQAEPGRHGGQQTEHDEKMHGPMGP